MKKIIIIICSIIVVVLFSVVAVPKFIKIFKFESEIPDVNGPDDYSLATLSEDDVLGDYGSKMWITGTSEKGNETNVSGIYKEIDRDEISSYAKIFDGVYTAQATKTSSNDLIFSFSSNVKSGNFAIYILVDGEIYRQADINCKTKVKLLNINDKLVLVKIVGEAAEYEFSVIRSIV